MSDSTRHLNDPGLRLNRRHFFSRTSLGLGGAALASLLSEHGRGRGAQAGSDGDRPGRGGHPPGVSRAAEGEAGHLPVHERRAVAARPVRLQAAAEREERRGPARRRSGWGSGSPGCRPTRRRCRWPARSSSSPGTGKSGAWVSDLLPHTAKVADELCFVKSIYTEAINHDPAITFFQTGSQIAGRPSMGAWLSYGLGSANENLPAFVVLISQKRPDQPLYSRLWGNGFLPSVHQGVAVPRRGRPGALPREPARVSAAGPAQDARPARASCTRSNTTRPRSRDRRPDRPVRDGLPHADERPRGDETSPTSPTTSSTCTARRRGSRAPSPPTACWPAGWPSATCGSSSSIIPAGTITAACPAASASSAARPTRPARP